MRAELQNGTSLRFASRLTQLLAIGWVAVLALVFMVHGNGGLDFVTLVQLAGVALPTPAIGPHFGEFWRAELMDAGSAIVILATAFAVGAVALNRWIPGRDLLAALFSLAAGLWILSVAVLLVGAVSLARLPWVFLLGACWLLPAARRFFHRPPPDPARLDGWGKLMLVCIIAATVLGLFGAMAPPFEYDEMVYHLGAPAEYLKAGHIVALPHNFYSNLPQLTEMLYLLAMKMSSGVAAKWLHWSFGVFAAVAVYAIAARLWTRRVGVTAAALFYCLPFVNDLSVTARVDLATTFFATLAFGALLVKRKEGSDHGDDDAGWWLAALAVGAAIATKWPAIPVVFLPAAGFVAVTTRSFRRLSIFSLLCFVLVVPWLVKNCLLTGNPVYPLFPGVFPSSHWSAAQASLFAEKHYATFNRADWIQFVERVWHYSFPASAAGGYSGGDPFASPLLLMTAPLILLLRNATLPARRAGWLFAAGYAGWFLLTFRPWRFLFPVFPLAALVGAYALHRLEPLEPARNLLRVAVATVMLAGLAMEGSFVLMDAENNTRVPPEMSALRLAFGQISRDEFAGRLDQGKFEPILWMNQHLPPTARVLYIGEARVYYAQNPVVWSTAFDQSPLEIMLRQARDAKDLFALMRNAHITHVYVNFVELTRLQKNYDYLVNVDFTLLDGLLKNYARLIHLQKFGAVYELENPA